MTKPRGTKTLATAALLLAVGSGCAGDDDRAANGATPPPSPTATTTTSAPPTDSEAASMHASALVRSYFTVLDGLRQRPDQPLSKMSKVATSVELSANKTLLQREREQGQRQVGDTHVVSLKVQSVNLDNSDPKAGKAPTVQVDVCWDVSSVDVVNKRGKSVVSPSRPDRGWIRFTVANYRWSADPTGGWRVASSQDLKQAPCVAS